MKTALLAMVGLFFGAIIGGILGVVLGFAWTWIFQTTSFEGYSGMLVFFTFMPIGMLLGGVLGGVGLGIAGSRDPVSERAPAGPTDGKP
jgi:hypothetical protein